MCSVILPAGIRSPVIGEIKNCSLAVGTAAAGLGAEVQDNKYTYILEMQQYIDISPYRDTLGSDTVSIHI